MKNNYNYVLFFRECGEIKSRSPSSTESERFFSLEPPGNHVACARGLPGGSSQKNSQILPWQDYYRIFEVSKYVYRGECVSDLLFRS